MTFRQLYGFFKNLPLDKESDPDTDDSEVDDIEEPPKSEKIEIPLNNWKDRDELVSM